MIDKIADRMSSDTVNTKVIRYLIDCKKNNKDDVTVADITRDVMVNRRVATERNGKRKYIYREEPMARSAAERIIDRLYYSGLIDIREKLPFKFLEINKNGLKVASIIGSNTRRGEDSND